MLQILWAQPAMVIECQVYSVAVDNKSLPSTTKIRVASSKRPLTEIEIAHMRKPVTVSIYFKQRYIRENVPGSLLEFTTGAVQIDFPHGSLQIRPGRSSIPGEIELNGSITLSEFLPAKILCTRHSIH